MKRLTTNEPKGMVESMRNMVFAKNNEIYLYNMGENSEDISLVDYCKKECKEKCDSHFSDDWNATTFGELMDCDCPVSAFYCACVGFYDIRQRLMKYEDADIDIEEIK